MSSNKCEILTEAADIDLPHLSAMRSGSKGAKKDSLAVTVETRPKTNQHHKATTKH